MRNAKDKIKLLTVLLSLFLSIHAKSQTGDEIKKISLDSLFSTKKIESGQRITVIDEPTITAAVYQLSKNEKDTQTYQKLDEVYYVLNGNAKLKASDTTINVNPGSVIYVRAKTEHHFFDVANNLRAIVIFSKAISKPDSAANVADYSYAEIANTASDSEDVWDPFLKRKTMVFGLYMLPQKIGGDSSLVHKTDEINIVTEGFGKFSVNGVDMNVQKGDIIFVRKGNNHFFHSLNADMKILILFETKSIQKL